MNRFVKGSAGNTPVMFIATGGLLAGGAVLTALGQPAIGWSMYIVGSVGALLAFAALAGLGRDAAGRFRWAAVAVLFAAVVVALPEMLMVWGLYVQNDFIHDTFMPYVGSPIVTLGGVAPWIGLLAVALAAIGGKSFPRTAVLLIIAAALIALPFELRLLPQVFWVGASILVFAALTLIGIASTHAHRAVARGS
ncbi:MAG: hypothetical protein M3153_07510 [Chloroflexota bacterium]|nr:hypothetical protein [Chloroflexota bacterium]